MRVTVTIRDRIIEMRVTVTICAGLEAPSECIILRLTPGERSLLLIKIYLPSLMAPSS